ncbi:hypothetical protein FQN54_004800 [Arachnomyces sp. PD_36]|nr:hypothetical protein FQN54_004800 [Arachnomyces sp. PD_36]
MADWFQNLFDQTKLDFANSTWLVEEKLSTKTIESLLPCQATAVYRCRQIEPASGKEGIIKIHMQIPHSGGPSVKQAANEEITRINICAKTEIDFLTHLTKHGCRSTPRLISHTLIRQTEEMRLPGGYIIFLLMEKLPGKTIFDFWNYDLGTRNRIRAAFKSAWMEMNSACVRHNDTAIRNILWDEEAEKCYILDFEDAEFIDSPTNWPTHEFSYWELEKKSQERKPIL